MTHTNYFAGVHTAEEAKELYRKLARKLHPDNGGSAEEFAAMGNEFEQVWNRLKDTHKTKEGKTYTSNQKTTESAREFMGIINNMINWEDVTIEIIGSWLWVSGNTYTHRKELKKMHFGFSSRKKAWYFHKEDFKKTSKKTFTMDDLRSFYGSETITVDAQPMLTA